MTAFAHSLRREWQRLRASPWDLAMVTWVPLLGALLLGWIFSAGLPRHLPVGVVDGDHSSLSRQLVRMLDATPGVRITHHYQNTAEAEAALRRMQVDAVVTIPRDFARDVKQGRVGQVTLLHNAQLGTHSGLLQRDVRAAVGTLSAGIEINARTRRGESLQAARVHMDPVHPQLMALFNVSTNYEQFLAAALIPALLHILAMTAGAWTVGRELRDRSLGEWLGGSAAERPAWAATAQALAGKLALPWASLTLVGGLALAGITAGRGWHPPGHLGWVMLALALLLAVSVAAGALLAGLTRSLRTALSGAGFFAAPAFAFSGVGFPLAGMPATARAWAEAMPYTHYVRLQIEQLQMGAPLRYSVGTVLALALATLVLGLLGSVALHRALQQPATWGKR